MLLKQVASTWISSSRVLDDSLLRSSLEISLPIVSYPSIIWMIFLLRNPLVFKCAALRPLWVAGVLGKEYKVFIPKKASISGTMVVLTNILAPTINSSRKLHAFTQLSLSLSLARPRNSFWPAGYYSMSRKARKGGDHKNGFTWTEASKDYSDHLIENQSMCTFNNVSFIVSLWKQNLVMSLPPWKSSYFPIHRYRWKFDLIGTCSLLSSINTVIISRKIKRYWNHLWMVISKK